MQLSCTLAKIIASLNILFMGYMPETPLERQIRALDDIPLGGDFNPYLNHHDLDGLKPTPARCTLVEVRGDWKFVRELFNLQVGWNSIQICHHCVARKDDYLMFPPDMDQHARRDPGSFLSSTRLINDPSDLVILYEFEVNFIESCGFWIP